MYSTTSIVVLTETFLKIMRHYKVPRKIKRVIRLILKKELSNIMNRSTIVCKNYWKNYAS